MRVLRFVVDGQQIEKDTNCDFNGIVPGTSGYLQADFVLSSEWSGCKIAASFFMFDDEYPVLLEKGRTCVIPSEALKWNYFEMMLTGIRPDGYKITTNKITIKQER